MVWQDEGAGAGREASKRLRANRLWKCGCGAARHPPLCSLVFTHAAATCGGIATCGGQVVGWQGAWVALNVWRGAEVARERRVAQRDEAHVRPERVRVIPTKVAVGGVFHGP